MSKLVESGDTVSLHYVGTFPDGEEFDNSYGRGEAVEVTVGAGMLISGFDAALVGMSIGEKRHIELTTDEAYGDINPQAYVEVAKDSFPNDFPFEKGAFIPLTNEQGGQFIGRLDEVVGDNIRVDLNHPMAGKDLNFDIEVISIASSADAGDEGTEDTEASVPEGTEG